MAHLSKQEVIFFIFHSLLLLQGRWPVSTMYFSKMNNSIFASPCVCILLLLLKNVFDDWNLILALNILHILQLRFKGFITEISRRTVFNYWFVSCIFFFFFKVWRFRLWYSVKHIYIMPRRESKCSVSKFTNFNIFYGERNE